MTGARVYWVPEVTVGRLGFMPRPSTEWLQDDVAAWRRDGVGTVVSLLEAAETRELQLGREAAFCEAAGIAFISFPIVDRGVPASTGRTSQLVSRLAASIGTGASVAVHCRAGIGRSSLIAGCVLLRLGFTHDDVFPTLTRARGLQVPDTPEQVRWLATFQREAADLF
jgi:protein-tyrosine phosphatase